MSNFVFLHWMTLHACVHFWADPLLHVPFINFSHVQVQNKTIIYCYESGCKVPFRSSPPFKLLKQVRKWEWKFKGGSRIWWFIIRFRLHVIPIPHSSSPNNTLNYCELGVQRRGDLYLECDALPPHHRRQGCPGPSRSKWSVAPRLRFACLLFKFGKHKIELFS